MTSPRGRSDPPAALLKRKMREVFHHLPSALGGDAEAIHQMRVAGRRLRVALPLLAQRPQGKRVRRALVLLRDLTRGAGASRDLDVMLGLVSERSTRPRSPEQTRLLRNLRASRKRSRARMTDALLDLEIAKLRRYLRRILARGGELTLAVLVRARLRLEEERQSFREIAASVAGRFDAEALHRLRIGARRIRYIAELLAELTERPYPGSDSLRGLQDELGEIRDLYLVSVWFGHQAAAADARALTDVAAEARRQSARFLRRSQARCRVFMATNPAQRLDEAVRRSSESSPAA
jgi:CHAD domain-containing protein